MQTLILKSLFQLVQRNIFLIIVFLTLFSPNSWANIQSVTFVDENNVAKATYDCQDRVYVRVRADRSDHLKYVEFRWSNRIGSGAGSWWPPGGSFNVNSYVSLHQMTTNLPPGPPVCNGSNCFPCQLIDNGTNAQAICGPFPDWQGLPSQSCSDGDVGDTQCCNAYAGKGSGNVWFNGSWYVDIHLSGYPNTTYTRKTFSWRCQAPRVSNITATASCNGTSPRVSISWNLDSIQPVANQLTVQKCTTALCTGGATIFTDNAYPFPTVYTDNAIPASEKGKNYRYTITQTRTCDNNAGGDGQSVGWDNVVIPDCAPVNVAPTVNAGDSHVLTISTPHTHTTATAYDPNDNLSTYSWAFTSCPPCGNTTCCPALSGTVSGSFGAGLGDPAVSVPGPTYTPLNAGYYNLRLTVTDTNAATGTSTISDSTENGILFFGAYNKGTTTGVNAQFTATGTSSLSVTTNQSTGFGQLIAPLGNYTVSLVTDPPGYRNAEYCITQTGASDAGTYSDPTCNAGWQPYVGPFSVTVVAPMPTERIIKWRFDPWIDAELIATPPSGTAPFNPSLTASSKQGPPAANVRFSFDCENDGIIDAGPFAVPWNFYPTPTSYTYNGCAYSSAATARAVVSQAGISANPTVDIGINAELGVTCNGMPNPQSLGSSVFWRAYASGGTGVYTYSWTGDEGLSGTSNPISKIYAATGNKTATVTVTDGATSKTVSCNVDIIPPPAPSCNLSFMQGGSPALASVYDTAPLPSLEFNSNTATDATLSCTFNAILYRPNELKTPTPTWPWTEDPFAFKAAVPGPLDRYGLYTCQMVANNGTTTTCSDSITLRGCGDLVCDSADGETNATCPSDCLPTICTRDSDPSRYPWTIDWTPDSTIIPGSTLIKASHFAQMRDAIIALRRDAGLETNPGNTFNWAACGFNASAGQPVSVKLVNCLRQALRDVYTTCGQPYENGSEIPVSATQDTPIRAQHILEIRNAIQAAK